MICGVVYIALVCFCISPDFKRRFHIHQTSIEVGEFHGDVWHQGCFSMGIPLKNDLRFQYIAVQFSIHFRYYPDLDILMLRILIFGGGHLLDLLFHCLRRQLMVERNSAITSWRWPFLLGRKVFFLSTIRILGMSWGVKTTCLEAPGVSLGGSGVSIGGVRI